ncbi:hypothetical protein [Vibrio sp. F13]|uniref:hypothetical protein n=1 Tax=Vibrio sp. F13 TaxID=2070777 RepID=UPI0010BD9854|nr:hypothetical protein [Vibrio sp. F13]TKG09028.1 hypothetical protein FCV67_07920 [Vibrio sp. F13]
MMSVGAGELVPSQWTPSNNLLPTAKWLAGSFVSAPITNIQVSFSGHTVTLPVQVTGYQYHLGSSPGQGGQQNTSKVCTKTVFSSPILSIQGGASCFSDVFIETPTAVTPYAFIRPSYYIDPIAWQQAFAGKPKGDYTGTVSLSSYYHYYQGAIRTQRLLSYPLTVNIEHEPAYITDVVITGQSTIQPNYDPMGEGVSGQTQFSVMATGWFTNGMTVGLNRLRAKDYQMLGPSLTYIPYSIVCHQCTSQLLVDEGVVINDTTIVPGSNVSTLSFSLAVGYKDVALSTLQTGVYQDTFVLIFEPNI